VKLDPVLLDILVCPDCKGSLTVDYDNDELICNQCGLIYPVRDDIPIMLVDEARRPDPPTVEGPAAPDADEVGEESVAPQAADADVDPAG
jgi:uncharacterized protein YbaR (Trm112 family)